MMKMKNRELNLLDLVFSGASTLIDSINIIRRGGIKEKLDSFQELENEYFAMIERI